MTNEEIGEFLRKLEAVKEAICTDTETNVSMSVSIDSVPKKREKHKEHFVMSHIDGLQNLLKFSDTKDSRVVQFILRKTVKGTCKFEGTYDLLCEKCNTTRPTVSKALMKAERADILRKKSPGLLMINPRIMNIKGESEYAMLLDEYFSLPKETSSVKLHEGQDASSALPEE